MNPPVIRSIEAEREVLSAVFIDERCLPALAAVLKPQSFELTKHQILFAVMLDMAMEQVPIDTVTLGHALKVRGLLEKVGGARTLGELLDRHGSVANVGHYAAIVAEMARERAMFEQAGKVQADILRGYSENVTGHLIELSELVAQTGAEKRATWSEVVQRAVNRALDTSTRQKGLRLGIGPVDEHIGGIGEPDVGWFVGLYGPPEGLKTAVALNNLIAANTGEDDVPGALFTLEMNEVEVAQRILADASGVPTRAMRNRDLTPAQVPGFIDGADRVAPWPLEVFDDMLSADEIYAHCVALKQRGCRYVVIDHLGEIENGLDTDNANDAKTVRVCKNIRKKLGMTVFLIMHTAVEANRTGTATRASSIRGTGRILGSLDLAVTIQRGKRDRNHVGFVIGKGRHCAQRTWHAEDEVGATACGWRFDPVRLKVTV